MTSYSDPSQDYAPATGSTRYSSRATGKKAIVIALIIAGLALITVLAVALLTDHPPSERERPTVTEVETTTSTVYPTTKRAAADAPTPSGTAPAAIVIEDPNATPEQLDAVQLARLYADGMNYSAQGIANQMVDQNGDNLSPELVKYALAHLKVDYNANALASAQKYLALEPLTDDQLKAQLTSEFVGFTEEQADYAIAHLDRDSAQTSN